MLLFVGSSNYLNFCENFKTFNFSVSPCLRLKMPKFLSFASLSSLGQEFFSALVGCEDFFGKGFSFPLKNYVKIDTGAMSYLGM